MAPFHRPQYLNSATGGAEFFFFFNFVFYFCYKWNPGRITESDFHLIIFSTEKETAKLELVLYFNYGELFIIVGRGFLTPLFYKTPPKLLSPFFQILSNPRPALLFALFIWLNLWSCQIERANVILLNNIMDLNLPSLGTLVPAAPCCVLCNKESNLL